MLIISAPHQGQKGTVAAYEGCWSSRCFPVAVDFVGRTALYDVDCVSELDDDTPVQPLRQLVAS
nr:hypothetical protein [Kibdelosporangium sp. MJ126-NF4]CTQ89976.1 hypothetical protein [Kibdelosporangium sp. MJ126-NF4]